MKQQRQAYLYALGAVLLWSTVATAFKIALRQLDTFRLLFYANLVAFVVLLVIFLLEKRVDELRNISYKELRMSAVRGILNPFLYYLVLFKAYDILPAQEAMSLNYIWPIVLVLLAVPVLRQKLGAYDFAGILISFAGSLVIVFKGQIINVKFNNLEGDLLALSSSVIWALFWLSNMKCRMSEVLKLLLSFGFGLLFLTPLMFLYSGFSLPSLSSFLSVAYVGIAEMGLTFYLWLNALQKSEHAHSVSRLIYLSPFLSLIFISLFLHEKIDISTVAGLVLIIAGIVIKDGKRKTAGSK